MSRAKWLCPNCGSTNVEVLLPAWFYVFERQIPMVNGRTRIEDIARLSTYDEDAEQGAWVCNDCDESGDESPTRNTQEDLQ
jgi:hypothetical protein